MTLIDSIDFVLNGICVVLWLNWCAVGIAQPVVGSGISLLTTLKRAETRRINRWVSLAALSGILILRAAFYWLFGFEFAWTFLIDLGPIAIPFRADYFGRVALYSVTSFGLFLGVFYSSLLLLSILNKRTGENDYLCRLLRLHLRGVESSPAFIKLLLPVVGAGILWMLFAPLLRMWGMVPPWVSWRCLWEQAVVFGVMALLTWRYALVLILLLYLIQSYVYLGNHYSWSFLNLTAKNILRPLENRSIQLGKFDLRPAIGIVVILGFSACIRWAMVEIYQRLPI